MKPVFRILAVLLAASLPGCTNQTPDASDQGGNTSPLAVAPFDGAEAKRHQEASAKHLGAPVELENSIGMKLVLIPAGESLRIQFAVGLPQLRPSGPGR
jgi:hypothetical protein